MSTCTVGLKSAIRQYKLIKYEKSCKLYLTLEIKLT